MIEMLLLIALALLVGVLGLQVFLLIRGDSRRLEQVQQRIESLGRTRLAAEEALQSAVAHVQKLAQQTARQQQEALREDIGGLNASVQTSLGQVRQEQAEKLAALTGEIAQTHQQLLAENSGNLLTSLRTSLGQARAEQADQLTALASEIAQTHQQLLKESVGNLNTSLRTSLGQARAEQADQLTALAGEVAAAAEAAGADTRNALADQAEQHHRAFTDALAGLKQVVQAIVTSMADLTARQQRQLEELTQAREQAREAARQRHEEARTRQEALTEALSALRESVLAGVSDLADRQEQQLGELARQQAEATQGQENQLARLDQNVQARFLQLGQEQGQSIERLRAELEVGFTKAMGHIMAEGLDGVDQKLATLDANVAAANTMLEEHTRPLWDRTRDSLRQSHQRTLAGCKKLGTWSKEHYRRSRENMRRFGGWLRRGKGPTQCRRGVVRAGQWTKRVMVRAWRGLRGLPKRLRRSQAREAADSQ